MAGGAALATASLIRPREARAAKSMMVVLESEVTILDPHVITATITRTFGLHVFDMLFAMNEKGEIKPQMVEGYDSSPDKLTWTFTLRDGLKWHDGSPVTAEDCVASLKRWSVRDPLGKMLMADTDQLDGDRRQDLQAGAEAAVPVAARGAGQAQCAAAGDDAGQACRDAGRPAHRRPGRLGPVPLPQGPVAAGQRHGAGAQSRLCAAQGSAGLPGRRQEREDRPARRCASCPTSRPAPTP